MRNTAKVLGTGIDDAPNARVPISSFDGLFPWALGASVTTSDDVG